MLNKVKSAYGGKKKLLFFFVLLISTILIFNFYTPSSENSSSSQIISPPPPGPSTGEEKFLIGVMESYFGNHATYNDAGLNLTHYYVNTENPGDFPKDPLKHTPSGRVNGNDFLYSPVPSGDIRARLNDMYQHNNSRFFWMRPKIEWLVYGQSSIYKAFQDNPDYWFYGFNDVNGERYPDVQWNSGKDVLHCSQINLGPGAQVVLKRLKANTEQSRTESSGNHWQADNECDWYVKPRIRINPSVVQNYPNTEVCRVHIKKENGTDKIPPVTILARHFQKFNDPNLYDGRYIEEFYFRQVTDETPTGVLFPGALGVKWAWYARGECPVDPPLLENRSDIQIEWLDNCEMWLDYVKVENDVANRLLKGNDPVFEQWIQDEVNAVKDPPPGATESAVYNFYIELFEFNNIPCMAYVNQKIQQYSLGKIGLMADLLTNYQYHLPWWNRGGAIISPEKLKSMFYDVTGFDQVFIGDPYPITASKPQSCGGTYQYNLIPNTFGVTPDGFSMFKLAPPNEYDAWLQGLLDTSCIAYEGGSYPLPEDHSAPLIGVFRYLMKHGNQVSALTDKPFIAMLQAHQWYKDGEIDREPTVEELNLMTNEAVAYGAKGIVYWWWPSFYDNTCQYSKGLMEQDGTPRQQNYYGQPKWQEFKTMTERLERWGPTLMKFKNDEIKSYIYRYPLERAGIVGGCVRDVYTYLPNCPETDYNPTPEPENSRYIQLATFDDLHSISDVNERYFMVVNKRCSPHTQNDCGGLRWVKVKLGDFGLPDATGFLRFRNLNIIDVETGNIVVTFDKEQNNGQPVVDLGWFEPGEGKLYKLAPTLLTGGTLVADEDLNGIGSELYVNNYDVSGVCYSNGHDVFFETPITFNFAENSGWVFENCRAGLGTSAGGYGYFQGKNGAKWNGITASNCIYLISYAMNYKDIKNGNYALNLTNPAYTSLAYCAFDYSDGNTTAGGININNNLSTNPQQIIYECTFNMSASNMQAINIVSSPYSTRLQFDNININRSYTGSSIGMFLSGCTGSVKNCFINQPNQGIITVNSNLDIYHNQIYGSEPLYGTAYSYFNMAPSRTVQIAGCNILGNTYRNIVILNSAFNILNGNNTFYISAGSGNHHLLGYVPADNEVSAIDVSGNCFYVEGTGSNPVHFITLGSGGQQIDVLYSGGNNCSEGGSDIAFITQLSENYSDTVYQYTEQIILQGEAYRLMEQIAVKVRKTENDSVIIKCINFLNNYPDSLGSAEAVEELFYASLTLDSAGSKIQPLKSLYETWILNNPENTTLVNMLFYYIQKCKVAMGEYNSALSGFQQIINQNPYSYEGLAASWDYMSTYLLDSLGGSGGETGDGNTDGDGIKIRDDFDNDKFSEQEITSIKQNIISALEDSKKKQDAELNTLKQMEQAGDNDAAVKLKVKNALKESVRVRRPKDENEFISLVNEDIKKVFSIGSNSGNSVSKGNNLPTVFSLSQNFPNPFNPVTTIKYALPMDVKVVVKIYDILGREVKTLVNQLQTAGYYEVKFDMSSYASGVYFYRIEAESFVQSKKMVLVK
jgi:tetratricopeptide (TPR) repeat protein